MKRVIVILLLVSSSPLGAQWRKIHDFFDLNGDEETVTSVYFLDLPGPPRIGFVGTDEGLWKTEDGAKTWKHVFGKWYSYSLYGVVDIAFKDSLTGWIALYDGGGRER